MTVRSLLLCKKSQVILKMMDFTTCEERKEFSAGPLNTKRQSNRGQLLDAVEPQLSESKQINTHISDTLTMKWWYLTGVNG